jgi:hypothetical protein
VFTVGGIFLYTQADFFKMAELFIDKKKHIKIYLYSRVDEISLQTEKIIN